jgi:regulator of protease activity HflC (stomatin/prohibitin superfamily)
MADFTRGVPESARAMLRETAERDVTVANLFFRTILEEVTDVAMVEDVLQPDMLERLRELKAFRDYEARVKASAEADAREFVAKAEASAKKAEADAKKAEADAKKAEADAKIDDLTQFFFIRGDQPSAYALSQISACTDVRQLSLWLRRAYAGETSAEIFPEP